MMKFFKLSLGFLFILLSNNCILSQDSLAIGEWDSHLPYKTGSYISQSPEKVFYSTTLSLFTVDKEYFNIEFYDKINFLSDIGISKHKYDLEGEQLMVVYDNSNIDIIQGNEIINVPDIKNNSSILGDKRINNLQINEDRTVFLSCGFGLVQFDLDEYEFTFSSFTGVVVNQATYFNENIIIATEDGLYIFDTEKHNNPADFLLWDHMGQNYQLPEIYRSADLMVWNGSLYMSTGEDLWKAGKDLEFEKIFSSDNDSSITFLNRSENDLMVGLSFIYGLSKILYFDAEDNYVQGHHECAVNISFAEMDDQGRIWYADADKRGGIKYANNKIYPCDAININSPFSNNVSDIETLDDKIFIASGGVDPSYTYVYRRDGFFIWDGENWKNYNEYEYPVFRDREIYDFFRILPGPDGNKIYIGSYHRGLIVLDPSDGSMEFYDQNNSTLAGKSGDLTRERISGLAFDENNNLWISNFGASKPISVFKEDGSWVALDVDSGKDLRDVVIDKNGYKWFIVDRESEGILVFDEGDDLEDPTDDRQVIIAKNNSELQSNKVNAIEVDMDGDVWVGTEEGPVVFECSSSIFDSGCSGSRRQAELEGILAYLLDETNITCIETDGANRKWFGSENGIFVQSASGKEQIHHFTKENSPLFDNKIIDLAYNGSNGIMYIATAKGVLSYRSPTTEGGSDHRGDIYAYPNPVRPEYNGPIAIKGFARDSNIKITDIKGHLIYETTSLGGQAIWDGYDYNGRRAASGVYLVYATSSETFDEPDAIVTKILLVR